VSSGPEKNPDAIQLNNGKSGSWLLIRPVPQQKIIITGITLLINMEIEQMVDMWQKMTPAEQRNGMEMGRAKCFCTKCPPYTSCAKNAQELLFCATGKSFMRISDEKSCLCPTCPVTPEYGLKYQKFCIRGSEMAQRYENTLWGTSLNR
jgi:hypothetical protein